MHYSVLGSLILSCISTSIAASSSNCSNSSDIQVVQYASVIQDYSNLFYTSIPLNKTFLSGAPNSSDTNYYLNIQGMSQQNNISTQLLELLGSNITGFQSLNCKFTYPNPVNATVFLDIALYIETTLAGAFIALSEYTQTPDILLLINWLAVQHGTHATYIESFRVPVVFPPNGTSSVPVLPPDYVLGTGNEPFMLGRFLGGWILQNPDFQQWRNDQQSRLIWIRGDPGKGKTMLLCGIIDELKMSVIKPGTLSFFFCQASDLRINNAKAVLRGLTRQLVDQQPSLISHLREKYDRLDKGLYEDTNSWVALSQIFTNILEDHTLKSTILVIDGLDECQDGLRELLELIEEKWSSYSHVKWIVSSRNWLSIQERLDTASQVSLELNAESVSTAVRIYIQHKVHQLGKLKKYDAKTEDAVQQHLFKNTNDTFLWVALVCQYLSKVQWSPLAKLDMFPPGLDPLYERMMNEVRESDDMDICRQILGFITVVYRPITLMELASFVEILEAVSNNVKSLEKVIGLCGSFLTVRESTVYFVHQSAKDFLITKAFNEIFPSGMEEVHHTIFSRSLHTMNRTLQRDIYSLCSPGFPITKVKKPDPNPLVAVQYSCIYWVDHLHDYHSRRTVEQDKDFQDGGMIDDFLRRNYLHWLEALGLLGGTSEGVLSMLKLEGLVKKSAKGSRLFDLVRDACRFILYYKGAIENSPLQVYTSALVFSPARSVTRCGKAGTSGVSISTRKMYGFPQQNQEVFFYRE